MSFYEQYKPFRNYMRRFALIPGLVDVWRYSLHIMERQPLPPDYAVGMSAIEMRPLKRLLQPWDLDLIARELVLNAGTRGQRSLRTWRDLALAINHIRELEDAAFTHTEGPRDALFELHRHAQRQFPWHPSSQGVNAITRYLKVFGEAAVDDLVVREMGMTTKQLIDLGMAVGGHFLRYYGMSTNQHYGVLGIPREASDAFFRRVTCSMDELKEATIESQAYDRDWVYAWNPLERKPLVAFDATFPDRVLCPIPRYLLRRTTAGIFFDLIKASGFDTCFGKSFQAYVGDIIAATCPSPRFAAMPEEPYYVGKNKMDGVDWILSDSTAHLFVESKAKRLKLNARILSNTAALEEDLVVLAKAIVQHYLNIQRALDGHTNWVPDNLPVYPLVLTLEDWFIFSPKVQEMLTRHVRVILHEKRISASVLETMPYTIASASEFEIASQIIGQYGIGFVMAKKTATDRQHWSWVPFLTTDLKRELQSINYRLFADDFASLRPMSEPNK